MDKKMTDAELVEAVAKEVLGWKSIVHGEINKSAVINIECVQSANGYFNPFHDMNDLQTIKDQFERYHEHMDKRAGIFEVTLFDHLWQPIGYSMQAAVDKVRAWLEAALMATRERSQ